MEVLIIMKVIAINGSPRENGNTAFAISVVGEELTANGIEFEVLNIGKEVVRGCIGCGGCAKNRNEKCVFDDAVNSSVQKMKLADGIIISSPVYYASISGTAKAFYDRVFYVAGMNGGLFRHKVGASVAAVRRSGEVTTFDHLNHYFTISEIFLASGNYWNVIHGTMPGDSQHDAEGVQTMRVLGRNMAWLLKIMEFGKGKIDAPSREQKTITSFIRNTVN